MKKEFTPIAMRCTKEQFEAIKPKLEGKRRIFSITAFNKNTYLCLFNDGEITNGTVAYRADKIMHETWNEQIFLEACGIETKPKDVFEITKEQILKIHKLSCLEGKKYIKEDLFHSVFKEENKKVVLERGKWYKHKTGPLVFKTGKSSGYGFDYKCVFENDSTNWSFDSHPNNWKVATESEVFEALKNEVVKKYKKGDLVDCLECKKASLNCELILDDFDHYFIENELWVNFINRDSNNPVMCCVFKGGKWATVIEKEIITTEIAEELLNHKYIIKNDRN